MVAGRDRRHQGSGKTGEPTNRKREQGISAAQYQKVARVSKPTATRHLTDLLG